MEWDSHPTRRATTERGAKQLLMFEAALQRFLKSPWRMWTEMYCRACETGSADAQRRGRSATHGGSLLAGRELEDFA